MFDRAVHIVADIVHTLPKAPQPPPSATSGGPRLAEVRDRNALPPGPARNAQSNVIRKRRRKLARQLAVLKLRSSKAQGPQVRGQTPLIESGGNELITPIESLRAISEFVRSRYKDIGDAARSAVEKEPCEVRALALDCLAGPPLVISEEVIVKAIGTPARRNGTAPGPDGGPCEYLWALGGRCITLVRPWPSGVRVWPG